MRKYNVMVDYPAGDTVKTSNQLLQRQNFVNINDTVNDKQIVNNNASSSSLPQCLHIVIIIASTNEDNNNNNVNVNVNTAKIERETNR